MLYGGLKLRSGLQKSAGLEVGLIKIKKQDSIITCHDSLPEKDKSSARDPRANYMSRGSRCSSTRFD